MDSQVKVEVEDVPEVTENDVYVDIAEEDEIYNQVDTLDVTPHLAGIQQEAGSTPHWHWTPKTNLVSLLKWTADNEVNKRVHQIAKESPSSEKASAQAGCSDDEEVDVDTPYSGTLRGQTQDKNGPVADHPTPCYSRKAYSSLFRSRLRPQEKLCLSSSTSEIYSYNPQEWLKSRRNKSVVNSIQCATSSSLPKGMNTSRVNVAKKSTATRRKTDKNPPNIAQKSKAKQSKPGNCASSDSANKSPASQTAAKGQSSIVNTKLATEHSTPDAVKPGISALLNTPRKSTTKPSQSYTSISDLHSHIVRSSREVPIDSELFTSDRPLHSSSRDTSENEEHQSTELKSSDLDRYQSCVSSSTISRPDNVSDSEKLQADSVSVAGEKLTPSPGPSQTVSQQTKQTVFTFVEKSIKIIECPECFTEYPQISLRSHLEIVHKLQVRTCTKCKTGFTDLDQYSEHYAFHLQQEENKIANILKSQYNAGFARQRLTRTQRSQFMTKRKNSATVSVQPNEAAHPKSPSLHSKNLYPVKKPRLQPGAASSVAVYSRSPHDNTLSETPNKRTGTANIGRPCRSKPLLSNRGKELRERSSSLSSLVSEASSLTDMAEMASPNALSEGLSSMDLWRQIRRQRSPSSYVHSPLSKLQRVERLPVESDTETASNSAYEEMSADEDVHRRQHQSPSKAVVELVSLESASQPFNCRICLKAFHSALTCPGSFRQFCQNMALATGGEPGSVKKRVDSIVHRLPQKSTHCAIETNWAVDSDREILEDKDEATSVSLLNVLDGHKMVQDQVNLSPEEDKSGTGGAYVCKVCQRSFQYHSELLKHALYHSYQFACGLCNRAYQQKGDLFDHFEIVHGGEMRFRCKYCERRFEDVVRFQSHVKMHKDGTVVNCTVCNKKFSSSQPMLQHLRNSHGPCEVCGKKFVQERQFVKHVQSAHMKHVPAALKITEATHAQTAVKHSQSEQLHTVTSHEKHAETVSVTQLKQEVPKRLHCIWCRRVFRTVQGLLSHKRNHNRIRSTPSDDDSTSVQTEVAPLQSNISSPQLSPASHIMSRSTWERRTTAQSQPKAVSQMSTVKALPASTKVRRALPFHLNSRLGSYLTCQVCNKQISSLSGLKNHYSHLHNGVPLPKHLRSVNSGGVHSCLKCDKHFFSYKSVQRHLRLSHTKTSSTGKQGESSVQQKSIAQTCRKCGRNFCNQPVKTYLAHTKLCCAKQSSGAKGNAQPAYSCALCEKAFVWAKNLARHMIIAHRTKTPKNIIKPKCVVKKRQLYLCKICRLCFTEEKSYKLHKIQKCKGNSGFFHCRICMNKFTRGDNLDTHIRTVHGRLPYLCRGCHVDYNTAKDIFGHICKHIDVSKQLDQGIVQPGQKLMKMIQTEDLEYHYWCGECSAGFNSAHDWTAHMQEHFDADTKDSGYTEKDHSNHKGYSSPQSEDYNVILEEYDSFPFLESGDEDSEQNDDDELCRIDSTISESEQTAQGIEVDRQTRQEHPTYPSSDPSLPEERENETTKLTRVAVRGRQDSVLDLQMLGVNGSHVFERKTVQPNSVVEDELSLSAFEEQYVTAWNSEFSSSAGKSAAQVEVDAEEKETSGAIHVLGEPERSVAVHLHSDKDKSLTENVSNGGMKCAEDHPQSQHDLCVEDPPDTVAAFEGAQQVVSPQETAAGDEQLQQAAEKCKSTELTIETLEATVDSLKQKATLADGVQKSQPVNTGGNQDGFVEKERKQGGISDEAVTTAVYQQSQEAIQNEKVYEARSSGFHSALKKDSFTCQICNTVFAEKGQLIQHKCDETEPNTGHAAVFLESSELTLTPGENSSTSGKAVGLISNNSETDSPSCEWSRNQECREEGNAHSQSDVVHVPVESTEHSAELHQLQADNKSVEVPKSDLIQIETISDIEHQKETVVPVADGNQHKVSVNEENHALSKKGTDEKGIKDTESQSRMASQITNLQQNEAEKKTTDVTDNKKQLNSHMLRCVSILKNTLAKQKKYKITLSCESKMSVQNLQEKSQNDAVTFGDECFIDGHQLTGTTGYKSEAARPNIFDIICSQNQYGVSEKQSGAHKPPSTKEPSSQQAAFATCELAEISDAEVSDGNSTNRNIGQSCSPPQKSLGQSISVSEPFGSEDSASPNTGEEQSFVDENCSTSLIPLSGESNPENKEQDRTDSVNTSQNYSDELKGTTDCIESNEMRQTGRLTEGKCISRSIRNSTGRVTEDIKYVDRVFPDGTKVVQNTQTVNNTDVQAAGLNRINKSSTTEDKHKRWQNIFDMLNCADCPVCKNPYKERHDHSECQRASSAHNTGLEMKEACEQMSVSEAAYLSDRNESGDEQYVPVGLVYIRKQSTEQLQNTDNPSTQQHIDNRTEQHPGSTDSLSTEHLKDHTDNLNTVVSESALCGSLCSGSSTPETPSMFAVEQQNETIPTQTVAASCPQTGSVTHLTLRESEADRNRLNEQIGSPSNPTISTTNIGLNESATSMFAVEQQNETLPTQMLAASCPQTGNVAHLTLRESEADRNRLNEHTDSSCNPTTSTTNIGLNESTTSMFAVEQQNETLLTQTVAASCPQTGNVAHLTLRESEADRNRLNEHADSSCNPTTSTTNIGLNSLLRKFGILAKFMTTGNEQNQILNREKKKETWVVQCVNQVEEPIGMVGTIKTAGNRMAAMDRQKTIHAGCRCETRCRTADHRKQECVQNYMARLAEKSLKSSIAKGKGKESSQDAFVEPTLAGKCEQESQINTSRQTEDDCNRLNKQGSRSNIFDILSQEDPNPLSNIDFSSEVAEMNKGTGVFDMPLVASHTISGTQGVCNRNMKSMMNTSVQNWSETELRKQLTELLLSNQQNSPSLDTPDCAVNLCDQVIGTQDEPVSSTQTHTKIHSEPARNDFKQMCEPIGYLEQCIMMDASVREQQHRQNLPDCNESKTLGVYPDDNGNSKQMSANETNTAQKDCSLSCSTKLCGKAENKPVSGMMGCIESLKLKLRFGDGLLSSRKGARQNFSAERPRREIACLSQEKRPRTQAARRQPAPHSQDTKPLSSDRPQ